MTIIPQTATDTRPSIAFHPLADIFPLMEGAEFEELVADIKTNALRYKITLYEGKILDGRNRYRAMLAAGHTPTKEHFFEYKPILSSDTPLSYVITANFHRRHLTIEQKRDIIAKLLKAAPEKSDRQIAKTVKASPTFVGKVRAEKEAAGDVSTVDTRTDTKGRKQPAKKGWSRERHQRHRARKRGRSIAGVTAAEKPTVLIKAWAVADREERREFVRVHSGELRGLLRELDEDKSVNAAVERAISRSEAQRPSIASNGPAVSTTPDDWPDLPECLRRSAPWAVDLRCGNMKCGGFKPIVPDNYALGDDAHAQRGICPGRERQLAGPDETGRTDLSP